MPDRKLLRLQLEDSVRNQTTPTKHLVAVDERGAGPQVVRNQLVKRAETDWILPVDDDDLLDPDCVEVLLRHSEDADVVYPFCRMEGRTDWCPNRLFHPKRLFRLNFIPNTALVRREFFEMVGGYKKIPLEDWDLWQRIYLHGGRFKCVPEVVWTYRFHDGNQFQPAPEMAIAA